MPRVKRESSTRPSLLILLFVAGVVLSACHTMEGLGEDLSTLGDKISAKAEKHSGD